MNLPGKLIPALLVVALSAACCMGQQRVRMEGLPIPLPGGSLVVLGAEDGASVVTVRRVLPAPPGAAPAEPMDVQAGDVVAFINGVRIQSLDEARKAYQALEPGALVRLGLRRGEAAHIASFARSAETGGARVVIRTEGGERTFGDAVIIAGRVVAEEGGVLKVVDAMREAEGASVDLQAGDRVLALNGTATPTLAPFRAGYDALAVGAPVRIRLDRAGREVTVSFEKPETPRGVFRIEHR